MRCISCGFRASITSPLYHLRPRCDAGFSTLPESRIIFTKYWCNCMMMIPIFHPQHMNDLKQFVYMSGNYTRYIPCGFGAPTIAPWYHLRPMSDAGFQQIFLRPWPTSLVVMASWLGEFEWSTKTPLKYLDRIWCDYGASTTAPWYHMRPRCDADSTHFPNLESYSPTH